MTPQERERVAALELDVDVRLADIWAAIMELESAESIRALLEDDDVRANFAAWLRVAYSRGYNDALQEAVEGNPGELHRMHGYATPF